MTRVKWALALVAGAAAIIVLITGCGPATDGPLHSDGAEESYLNIRPGQTATWGQPIYFNTGKERLTLVSVEPTQVSEGLELLGVQAGGREREVGIGVGVGFPTRGASTKRVQGYRLAPETTAAGRDGVELYTGVRAQRTGRYTVRGLTITYEADGKRYRERMQDAVAFCVSKDGQASKAQCPFPGLGAR